LALAAAGAMGWTFPIAAQSGGGDGFSFRRPMGSFTLRGGFARPGASSDVFSELIERLTIARKDFAGLNGAAEFGYSVSPRLDLQVGAAVASRRTNSEYRNFVGDDDLPISQRTAFRRIPFTAGLKFNLLPSGRVLSRLVWVPTRFVPYVAAGAGVMHYRFNQTGEFVDFQTLDVFKNSLTSAGWTGTAYGAVGASWMVTPSVSLITDVRYDRASATMGADFQGFDRIDLSAVGLTAGLLFRF